MIGEIGGIDEQNAADYETRSPQTGRGFIAGQTAPPGRRNRDTPEPSFPAPAASAAEKIQAFAAAGISVMQRPSDVVKLVKDRI